MPKPLSRPADLAIFRRVALALVFVLFGMALIDPFVLEWARATPPEIRALFKATTDIGRAYWMLISTGLGLALTLLLRRRHGGFRRSAAYGLIAGAFGFVFVSVAGASLVARLSQYVIGRARPKLYDLVGALEFKPFAFVYDYTAMPSGHATNSFALATAIAILWPRARASLYALAVWIAASRVMVGAHYLMDVVVGAALGTAFAYFVRERFAARRFLFERTKDGGYRLRGARIRG
jgi:undecaprenyl-diphosphatase